MFFFPLFDNNPTTRTPILSWLIIGTCILVFLWQQSLPPHEVNKTLFLFGFIPSHFIGIKTLPADFAIVPAWATIFTSMFMHGGWMHLGGNMLYLWIFGDNVEESMGRVKFVLFYCLCGAAAALSQMMINPASQIPMVGASGAIAGVLGAYLILHPKAVIRTFFLLIIFVRFINLPAWLVLGIWIGGQFVAVPTTLTSDGGGVAYFAHIGGFIAGMVLVPFFKHRHIPLFGRDDPVEASDYGKPMDFSTLTAEARHKYRPDSRRIQLGSRKVSQEKDDSSSNQQTGKARGSVPGFSRKKSQKSDPGPWG